MRSVRIMWMLVVMMFLSMSSFAYAAGTVNLPQTGQTKCYNASGTEITCANTGQDGEKLQGVAWPSPRFKDNGNGRRMHS